MELVAPVVECLSMLVLGHVDNELAFESLLREDFLTYCKNPSNFFIFFFIKMIVAEQMMPVRIQELRRVGSQVTLCRYVEQPKHNYHLARKS